MSKKRYVLVGRFTGTDEYPPYGDKWEAFEFPTRQAAIDWSMGPWYPDALILEIKEPSDDRPTDHGSSSGPAA